MTQAAWKFHDYDMVLDRSIKELGYYVFCPVSYRLTGCRNGSSCVVYRAAGETLWTRRTKNEGMRGSVRYVKYDSLDQALLSGVKWARRKDEEAAWGKE